MTRVRELHTNLSAEGRQEVTRMLHLLESNLIFVREVGQVDLQRTLEDLHEDVKSKEATHQGHENGVLRERFSLLQKALRDVLISRADADIERDCEESEFGQFARKEAMLAISEAQEGRDVLTFISETKKKAEERKDFVFGDQHSIYDLINQQRAIIDREFTGIVYEWQINGDVRKCVRSLEKHINDAAESNFNKLLQRDIAIKDVRELVDWGFSEMATEVREVDSLVQKSAALRSDRKHLLRATGQVESVVNKFLGSLKQAINKQSAWKKRVDELVFLKPSGSKKHIRMILKETTCPLSPQNSPAVPMKTAPQISDAWCCRPC
jgi:hypothetical protein